MKSYLAIAALAIAAAVVSTPSQAQSFVQVKEWDVYVDLPTRFAYVKTPMGWKFIRQLDEAQMGQLHPTTLTALLPAEQPEIQFAHPAMEVSPRVMAMRSADQKLAGAAAASSRQ